MPERPNPTDVIYQEEQDVLRIIDGKYVLTTHLEGGQLFTDKLEVDYRLGYLWTLRYQHHPAGVDTVLNDKERREYLARVDRTCYGYVVNVKDQPVGSTHCTSGAFFEPVYYMPGKYSQGDLCLTYNRDMPDGFSLSGIELSLPNLNTERRCLLRLDGDGCWCFVENGEFGRRSYFPFKLNELLGPLQFQGEMVTEVPITRTSFRSESLVILTGLNDGGGRELTVSRGDDQGRSALQMVLPPSLDVIMSSPDLTNPQAIFQKMQEIKDVLLGLKPKVTLDTVTTT